MTDQDACIKQWGWAGSLHGREPRGSGVATCPVVEVFLLRTGGIGEAPRARIERGVAAQKYNSGQSDPWCTVSVLASGTALVLPRWEFFF